MAQAKTSNARSRGGSSRSRKTSSTKKTNSKKTSTNAKSKSSSRSQNARSKGTSSRSRGSTTSRSSSQSSSRRSPRRESKSTVAKIAEKAKGPALAGGAALVGIAGGVALTKRNKRGPLQKLQRSLPSPKLTPPKLELPEPGKLLEGVGKAAGKVAERSDQVGRVAADVQRASDAINGNKS